MTKAFLILIISTGHGTTMTTIPTPYPYEECGKRGNEFSAVNGTRFFFFCLPIPSE